MLATLAFHAPAYRRDSRRMQQGVGGGWKQLRHVHCVHRFNFPLCILPRLALKLSARPALQQPSHLLRRELWVVLVPHNELRNARAIDWCLGTQLRCGWCAQFSVVQYSKAVRVCARSRVCV